MSHLILAFFTNFCPIENDLSGNTFWRKALVFKISSKLTGFFFWHFWWTFVDRKLNARNVECDFFCDFQIPCSRIFTNIFVYFNFLIHWVEFLHIMKNIFKNFKLVWNEGEDRIFLEHLNNCAKRSWMDPRSPLESFVQDQLKMVVQVVQTSIFPWCHCPDPTNRNQCSA